MLASVESRQHHQFLTSKPRRSRTQFGYSSLKHNRGHGVLSATVLNRLFSPPGTHTLYPTDRKQGQRIRAYIPIPATCVRFLCQPSRTLLHITALLSIALSGRIICHSSSDCGATLLPHFRSLLVFLPRWSSQISILLSCSLIVGTPCACAYPSRWLQCITVNLLPLHHLLIARIPQVAVKNGIDIFRCMPLKELP